MSCGSFIGNGWSNPLDLAWLGKIVHPLSVIRAKTPDQHDFDFEREPVALVGAARRHSFISLMTIALNPHSADESLLASLKRLGFLNLRPRIHFILKQNAGMPSGADPRNWWLLRSDIDTW